MERGKWERDQGNGFGKVRRECDGYGVRRYGHGVGRGDEYGVGREDVSLYH